MLRPYADSPKCLLVSSRPVSTRLAARVGRFLRRLRRQRRTWHGARGQCGGRRPADRRVWGPPKARTGERRGGGEGRISGGPRYFKKKKEHRTSDKEEQEISRSR